MSQVYLHLEFHDLTGDHWCERCGLNRATHVAVGHSEVVCGETEARALSDTRVSVCPQCIADIRAKLAALEDAAE